MNDQFNPNDFGNNNQNQNNQNDTQNTQNNPFSDYNGYPNGYQQPPMQQPMAEQPGHKLAMASLICSIIAFFCCGIPLSFVRHKQRARATPKALQLLV